MPVATVGAPLRRVGGSTATGAIAVTGGTAMIMLAGLWVPAWSRDEAATKIVVDRPLDQVWRSWLTDPALEPYYLLMKAWSFVSGQDWWLRLPSVLAVAATAGLVVLIVSRFLSTAAGIAAGALFAVLPAVTRYGQEARPYALVMLVCAALIWLWLSDRSLPGRRRALMAVGLIVVGLLHAYALIIWPMLLAVTLMRPERDRRRELTGLLVAGAVAVLALSPFLVLLSRRASGDPSPDAITLVNLINEAIRLPVAVLRPWGAGIAGALVLLLVALGIVIGWRRGAAARTLVVLGVAWLLSWITALAALQAVTGAPGLVGRYWTPALPALALCTAPLLDRLLQRSVVAAVAVVAVVADAGLPTQLALRGEDGHGGAGWSRLAAVLEQPALADLPLLAKGSTVRPLLANGVPLARMPLVRDPAPSGRVLAQADTDKAALSRLSAAHPVVLVLANSDTSMVRAPAADGFPGFRRELAEFSRPLVLCHYFGEPLGVFAHGSASPSDPQPSALAATLTEIDRGRIGCTVPVGG